LKLLTSIRAVVIRALSATSETPLKFSDFAFVAAVGMASMIVPFFPPDDLNRHLVAYQYGYNWRNLYLYSKVPSYDPWIGFDVLAGFLHRLFGYYAFVVVQELNFVLFSTALYLNLRGVQNTLGLLTFAFYVYASYGRILLGRPAEFVTSLSFISLHLPFPFNLILGSLTAPFYWLFWMYLLPLCIFNRGYVFSVASGLVFWYLYGGAEYFSSILDLYFTLSNERIFVVSENKSVLTAVLPNLVLFWPIFYRARFLFRPKDTFVFIYYLLLNQAKLFTALVLTSSRFLSGITVKIPDFFLLVALGLMVSHPNSPLIVTPKEASILKDHRVLVLEFGKPFFQVTGVVYPLKVAPAMEIGWTDRGIQELVKKAQETGRFDCELFKKYEFDYVVESSLKEYPACLELVSPLGELRVWKPKG